jgi:hypothetical protein
MNILVRIGWAILKWIIIFPALILLSLHFLYVTISDFNLWNLFLLWLSTSTVFGYYLIMSNY